MLNRKNMAPCMEAEKNMKENMTRKIKGWKFELNILIIDHLTNRNGKRSQTHEASGDAVWVSGINQSFIRVVKCFKFSIKGLTGTKWEFERGGR